MNKFIAAVIASAFAFGTVSTYAADAARKDELTGEQRSEMRERAARMKQQGQQATAPAADKVVKKSHKAKKTGKHAKKHTKKVSSKKRAPRHA